MLAVACSDFENMEEIASAGEQPEPDRISDDVFSDDSLGVSSSYGQSSIMNDEENRCLSRSLLQAEGCFADSSDFRWNDSETLHPESSNVIPFLTTPTTADESWLSTGESVPFSYDHEACVDHEAFFDLPRAERDVELPENGFKNAVFHLRSRQSSANHTPDALDSNVFSAFGSPTAFQQAGFPHNKPQSPVSGNFTMPPPETFPPTGSGLSRHRNIAPAPAIPPSNTAASRAENRSGLFGVQERFEGASQQHILIPLQTMARPTSQGSIDLRDHAPYTPRFTGPSYTPRFTGPSYTPRFTGPSYTTSFMGPSITSQDEDDVYYEYFEPSTGQQWSVIKSTPLEGWSTFATPINGAIRRPIGGRSGIGIQSSQLSGEGGLSPKDESVEVKTKPGKHRLEISNAENNIDISDGEQSMRSPEARKRPRFRQRRSLHGEVRQLANGSYEFKAFGAQNWQPAVYHMQYRRAMIEDMAKEGSYSQAPESGLHRDDQTSFHKAQKDWEFSGHQGWHPSQDRVLYRFQRGDLPVPQYTPGPLVWRNRVVLNRDSVPITAWENMPLTCSSCIEGGRMEQIQREDERITNADFRDRMPKHSEHSPLPGLSALGNRKRRFREANGLASWDRRDGTDAFTEAIRSHLSPGQLRRNTTMGFQGLTAKELDAIRARHTESGKFKSRAGKRSLDDVERRKCKEDTKGEDTGRAEDGRIEEKNEIS